MSLKITARMIVKTITYKEQLKVKGGTANGIIITDIDLE